jgi:hypothetical protein
MHDSQLGFYERDLCYWTRGGCRGESKLVVEALEDEQLLEEAPEWEEQEFLQAWIAELDARSSGSPTALAHASPGPRSGGGDRAPSQGDQGGHGKRETIDTRRVADKQHAFKSALPLATCSFEEPFTLPAHHDVPALPLRAQEASIEYPAGAGHLDCQELEVEGQRAGPGIGSVKTGVGWDRSVTAAGPVTAFEAAFNAAVSSIFSATAADPNATESTAVKEVCAADSAWQSFDIVDSAAARSNDSATVPWLASAVEQEAGNFVGPGTCKWKPRKVFCTPPVAHSTSFQKYLSIFPSVDLSFCIFR